MLLIKGVKLSEIYYIKYLLDFFEFLASFCYGYFTLKKNRWL